MIYTAVISLILIFVTIFSIGRMNVKFLLLSPPILISVFVLFYTVIGVYLFWGSEYIFLGVDFGKYMDDIYKVICVYLITFTFSFIFFYKSRNIKNISNLSVNYNLDPIFLFIYSASLFGYIFLYLNGMAIPVLHNFILIIFNSLIVILGYSFITKVKWVRLILALFVLIVIYLGFRYRLVLLLLPILFFVFINRKLSVVQISRYTFFMLAAVALVAIVGVSRNYSSGLSIDRLSNLSFIDLLIKGIFNDTSTVFASGAVISFLDRSGRFAYFDQIWYIVNYFVPKSIFDGKQYSPIFDYASIVTNQINNESGVAVLGFVEYYHTAGYFGVIGFAVLTAYFFANFFKRAIISGNLYYVYFYFSMMAWLINSLTRGYFPQNVQDLISVSIGFYLIKSKFLNKSR